MNVSPDPRDSSMHPPPLKPSLGELVARLASQSETLVQQEVSLAVKEMSVKAISFAQHSMEVVWGVVFAAVGLAVLAGSVVALLSTWMPVWFAGLLVAAVHGIVAYLVIQNGAARIREINPQPATTLKTLQENRSWVQALVR